MRTPRNSLSPWMFLSSALIFLALTLCSTAAMAQSDVIEDAESKRIQREREVQSAIQKAAETAEARRDLETGETVTYEEILADPDNIDLNFRFAKAQINRGDMVGASATLERILMLNPSLGPARMFYAIVLFRLDNIEEAEREFNILNETDLPEAQKQQVKTYLAQIHKRHQRTRFVASLSSGWGFETNRNAAPSSKKRMVTDTPTALTGTSRKRRDTNALLVSGLSVTHDLGTQAGHQLVGSVDYFLGEQTSADDLDLQSFSASGGAVFKTPLGDFSPTGTASYLYLSRESFLRSQGISGTWARALTDRFAASLGGDWTREDYIGITENSAAPERDGDRVTVNVGGRYMLNPSMQLSLNIAYENKDVKDDFHFNAYQGTSSTASHTWLLGKGQFLLSALTYTVNSYDTRDAAISARKRLDRQVRTRFSYGAPVGLLIGDWLPETVLENLSATFTLEQFRSMSNITNYAYRNTKLSGLLTKRIEF